MTSPGFDVARILQAGLGPATTFEIPRLDVAARYRAGGTGDVGGDWYDVLDLPDAGVALVVGDVAGRGAAAAVTMAHLRYALRAYALEDDAPAALLRRLNRLARWILPGEIATAVVAVLNVETMRVTIASAGHPPPLLIDGEGASFLQVANGPALGAADEPDYPEVMHDMGDTTILLFTDGLVERRGETIDAGLARLAQLTTGGEQGEALLDRLVTEVPDPAGEDDLAAVAVRCRTAA